MARGWAGFTPGPVPSVQASTQLMSCKLLPGFYGQARGHGDDGDSSQRSSKPREATRKPPVTIFPFTRMPEETHPTFSEQPLPTASHLLKSTPNLKIFEKPPRQQLCTLHPALLGPCFGNSSSRWDPSLQPRGHHPCPSLPARSAHQLFP